MIYEVFAFGGPFFWVVVAILFLILSALESKPRIGITVGSTVVLGAFTDMVNVLNLNLDLETLLRTGGYLGIGLITFFVLYSISIRLIRKDLKEYGRKHGLSDRDIGKALKPGHYGEPNIPSELRERYHNEPSWAGFYDRLLCWPTAIPNFFLGEFLRSFSSSIAEWLVQRRKKVVGFHHDDD